MYGLALEGGGAKGAFHMGAVKALLEEGYEFGGVTGTSIGALNGAIIAQGDFEDGYRLWESIDAAALFDIEEKQYRKLLDRKIDKELLVKLAARMRDIIEKKGIDMGKMRKVAESIISEEKLRSSKTDYGLVTVSITDLKPMELYKEDIPEGKMIDYIMASASFPGFKTNPIEDKYFIDGAFYDNCPVNLLARKRYKEIIAVRTYGLGIVQNLKYKNVKVTNIFPSEDLGGTLDFNNELIKRNLKLGYYDTMRMLKGLRGKKYYISPWNEGEAFELLCKLPDMVVDELGKLLKIKKMPTKRMLFEGIIPRLVYLLKLSSDSEYQDVILGLLEEIALEYEMDRFRIYTKDEFIEGLTAISSERSGKGAKISGLRIRNRLNKTLNDTINRKHELRNAANRIYEETCRQKLE